MPPLRLPEKGSPVAPPCQEAELAEAAAVDSVGDSDEDDSEPGYGLANAGGHHGSGDLWDATLAAAAAARARSSAPPWRLPGPGAGGRRQGCSCDLCARGGAGNGGGEEGDGPTTRRR